MTKSHVLGISVVALVIVSVTALYCQSQGMLDLVRVGLIGATQADIDNLRHWQKYYENLRKGLGIPQSWTGTIYAWEQQERLREEAGREKAERERQERAERLAEIERDIRRSDVAMRIMQQGWSIGAMNRRNKTAHQLRQTTVSDLIAWVDSGSNPIENQGAHRSHTGWTQYTYKSLPFEPLPPAPIGIWGDLW